MRRILLAGVVCVLACHGQLTTEQKQFDFRSLASVFAKRYAPFEWKRATTGFDMLDIAPWMDRVATANDLDFYDVLIDYVASLKDSHVNYLLPSSFVASVGIAADIYGGKVLIDSINRSQLPARDFPFAIGDEVVSVDGRPVEELIAAYSKYAMQANERATRRRAVERIFNRQQSRMPRAHEVGDFMTLVVQRRGGGLESYNIRWNKSGLPLTQIGPLGFGDAVSRKARAAERQDVDPLLELQHAQDPDPVGVLGYAATAPVFGMPPDFEQRLGRSVNDYFFSGVYQFSGIRVGFIRIPSYGPANTTAALAQFDQEIAWFKANTDGLVVDEMRNNGGLLCYGEDIVARLIPAPFRPLRYEIRATWEYMQSFYARWQSAATLGAPQELADQYHVLFNAIQSAYNTQRGRTEAVPVCQSTLDRAPLRDRNGALLAYDKPVIMLIDEFSVSTADSVAAMFQDNRRGPLVGMRTNGAGGSNSFNTARWQIGAFSEGDAGLTLALMVRKDPVSTEDYPTTSYVEGVGVRPDIYVDYMSPENLLGNGRQFMDAVTDAIIKQILAARGN